MLTSVGLVLHSALRKEDVRGHEIGTAVRRAWRRLFQKGPGEDVGVTCRQLQLRCHEAAHLQIDFLPDVPACCAGGDTRERRAARRVNAILPFDEPPGVVVRADRKRLERRELYT